MAKSKSRIQAAVRKRARKEAWKSMTPEKRAEWNLHRAKTAKTGYAKRQRERANGAPMAARTGEGLTLRQILPVHTRPGPDFAPWLREFQRMTARPSTRKWRCGSCSGSSLRRSGIAFVGSRLCP